MKIDPNKAFVLKRGGPLARAKSSVVVIHCTTTNCGRKTIVSRAQWQGEEEIVCANCGSTHAWEVM